jgi:hypothetical protein
LERLLLPLVERLKENLKLPPQEWFSIKEAAALTGLSLKKIRGAIKNGELVCSNESSEEGPRFRGEGRGKVLPRRARLIPASSVRGLRVR